jgi:hypothetical protein
MLRKTINPYEMAPRRAAYRCHKIAIAAALKAMDRIDKVVNRFVTVSTNSPPCAVGRYYILVLGRLILALKPGRSVMEPEMRARPPEGSFRRPRRCRRPTAREGTAGSPLRQG